MLKKASQGLQEEGHKKCVIIDISYALLLLRRLLPFCGTLI